MREVAGRGGQRQSGDRSDQYVGRGLGRSGRFEYYHIPSLKVLFTVEEEGNSLHCCDFSPSGQHFATAGRDCHIRIYDESTPRLT